jgi:hypothetical protein
MNTFSIPALIALLAAGAFARPVLAADPPLPGLNLSLNLPGNDSNKPPAPPLKGPQWLPDGSAKIEEPPKDSGFKHEPVPSMYIVEIMSPRLREYWDAYGNDTSKWKLVTKIDPATGKEQVVGLETPGNQGKGLQPQSIILNDEEKQYFGRKQEIAKQQKTDAEKKQAQSDDPKTWGARQPQSDKLAGDTTGEIYGPECPPFIDACKGQKEPDPNDNCYDDDCRNQDGTDKKDPKEMTEQERIDAVAKGQAERINAHKNDPNSGIGSYSTDNGQAPDQTPGFGNTGGDMTASGKPPSGAGGGQVGRSGPVEVDPAKLAASYASIDPNKPLFIEHDGVDLHKAIGQAVRRNKAGIAAAAKALEITAQNTGGANEKASELSSWSGAQRDQGCTVEAQAAGYTQQRFKGYGACEKKK